MLASVSHHSLCGPAPVMSAQTRSPGGGVVAVNGAIESARYLVGVSTMLAWASAARPVLASGAELASALWSVTAGWSVRVVALAADRDGEVKAVGNAGV